MTSCTLEELVRERSRSQTMEIIEVSKDIANFAKLMHISRKAAKDNKVPKIIHKIWWQGLDGLPEKYKQPLESWRMINPEWLIVIWDEIAINTLITEFYPAYEKLVHSYGMMIQKIDAAKYFMLEKVGGCYSDMDQFCINPIESIVDPDEETADIVCSLLTEKKSLICVTSSFRFFQGPYMNNAFIVSKAGAPHWQYVFRELERGNYYARAHLMDEIRVLNTTGPVCFTKGIIDAQKHIDHDSRESVRLLPSSRVDPFSIYFKFGKEKNFAELLQYIIEKDEAICISYEPSSWITGEHWYGGLMKTLIHWRYRHDILHIKHDAKDIVEANDTSEIEEDDTSAFSTHTSLLSPDSKLNKWIKNQKEKWIKLFTWMQEVDIEEQNQLKGAPEGSSTKSNQNGNCKEVITKAAKSSSKSNKNLTTKKTQPLCLTQNKEVN